VADRALLVELGDTIDRDVHDRVLRLDGAIAADPFPGFEEAVPAYASLLVSFDPRVTDHRSVESSIVDRLKRNATPLPAGTRHELEVCYDDGLGPDLSAVAEAAGITVEQVITAHLAGDYRVFMYGFAPGYAYLAGVPEPIRLPRKAAAVRGVAAGSVIIAGPQCLVTTLTMPTGWWSIGRSPAAILRPDDPVRPFLFDPGDSVGFRRISRREYDAIVPATGQP
jgi:inhibitor of KinA